MATATTPQHLDRVAAYLRQKRSEDVSLADVIGLAEITAQSLQTFFQTMDGAIYRELKEISDYIAAMKVEIGALRFKELRDFRIPAAGQELDAIVKAAEVASNTIMECAEAVMAVDAGDPAAYKTFIEDRMMLIFEACAFQDITGQRVAKVVETLQHIEVRVSRFAEAVRTKDLAGYLTEDERVRVVRKQTLLLHGPQLEGEGIEQSEVDGLMAPGRAHKK